MSRLIIFMISLTFYKNWGDRVLDTLHKKWSFPLRISLLNVVTKSTEYWGFALIYWEMLNEKLHFLCSDRPLHFWVRQHWRSMSFIHKLYSPQPLQTKAFRLLKFPDFYFTCTNSRKNLGHNSLSLLFLVFQRPTH